MRQAYDYWQDQPGISPRQTEPAKKNLRWTRVKSKYTEASQCKVKLVALGLPDNKQLSYPYKYNRSATRVLFTRRVKPTQKQYGNGGLQPKNPFRSQSPTYAVISSDPCQCQCYARCRTQRQVTEPGKMT